LTSLPTNANTKSATRTPAAIAKPVLNPPLISSASVRGE
jgi:hypothetical protein